MIEEVFVLKKEWKIMEFLDKNEMEGGVEGIKNPFELIVNSKGFLILVC